MRWFARRLSFYVFALWVALTINFLLPRLMPGDPIGGILQHLTPSQVQANPGIVQTYRILLGGGNNSIWQDYVTYLGRIVHLNFGISTSNYPAPVSEVIGKTLPYSIFLVGVAFLLAFVIGTGIGMVAAWRHGKTVDNTLVPAFMVLGAFPAFFTALLAMYIFGLQLHWFPIQHAYDSDVIPGLELDVPLECVPPRAAPDHRDRPRLHRRLGVEHAHGDDQHHRRGLRDDGAREGSA